MEELGEFSLDVGIKKRIYALQKVKTFIAS
jgi:hypothetical protein